MVLVLQPLNIYDFGLFNFGGLIFIPKVLFPSTVLVLNVGYTINYLNVFTPGLFLKVML